MNMTNLEIIGLARIFLRELREGPQRMLCGHFVHCSVSDLNSTCSFGQKLQVMQVFLRQYLQDVRRSVPEGPAVLLRQSLRSVSAVN